MSVFRRCKTVTHALGDTHTAAVHVIDISPHGLKGNASLTIVVDGLSDVKDVLISIAALMETEAPIGLHGRQANNFCILLRYLDGTRSGNKVKIEDSSKAIVLQILT